MHSTEPSFIRRYGLMLALAILVAAGVTVWLVKLIGSPKPSAPRPQEFSMVQVALPPPPPPPQPPQRPEPQQRDDEQPDSPREMIAQEPLAANEPDTPPDEAPAQQDASMGTNVQSDGPPDGFGLVGRGSGGLIGGRGTLGGSAGSGSGSRWGWYAMQVQRSIEDALRSHDKTRAAALRISVRVWPDASGRIERAELTRSSGDAELDRTLVEDIFTGLQLREAPPADMPLPITMRITAQRPN